LYYNKNTKEIEVGQGYWDIETVKRHIRERKFQIPAGAKPSKERLDKLRQKGYVQESGKVSIEDKKETVKMTTSGKGTFMDTVKKDMENAAYRSASTQMTSAVKSGIIMMMKDKGADGDKLKLIAELLDSEAGSATVSALLGNVLNYVPGIGEDPRVVRLAEEFRVAGYATGMNVIFGAFMQYVFPGIMEAMAKLPPVPKVVTVTDADLKEIERANAVRVRVPGSNGSHGLTAEDEREAFAIAESQQASKQARA
jgi:hypothetical protein